MAVVELVVDEAEQLRELGHGQAEAFEQARRHFGRGVVTGVAVAQFVDHEVGQGDDVDEHLVALFGQDPLAGILLVVKSDDVGDSRRQAPTLAERRPQEVMAGNLALSLGGFPRTPLVTGVISDPVEISQAG